MAIYLVLFLVFIAGVVVVPYLLNRKEMNQFINEWLAGDIRMPVKVKKVHKDAVIPNYAKKGDAGLDLTAVSMEFDKEKRVYRYDTGLTLEIPEGYVGLVFPRSSISRTDLKLCNSVGVIDSGYRGTIKAEFKPHSLIEPPITLYEVGDRICQIIIVSYPRVEFQESEELSESDRGEGGFGSSGK